MTKSIAVLGTAIIVVGVLLFVLSTISEQYQVRVPQEIDLIYNQQGFYVRSGQEGRTETFSCLSGDEIYVNWHNGSTWGPTTATGWFDIYEELSNQLSQRKYRTSFTIWLQDYHWRWTVPKSGNYYFQIINTDGDTIYFGWGGYTIRAEREQFEWRTRYPYRGEYGEGTLAGYICLFVGGVLAVVGIVKKK